VHAEERAEPPADLIDAAISSRGFDSVPVMTKVLPASRPPD